MEELFSYRTDLLSALEAVVGELSDIVAKAPAEAWHKSVRIADRTPHYSLFHLRELEAQVFTRELPRILAEKSPTLRSFDDQAWMASHYSPDEPIAAIMAEVAQLRIHELGWLRQLSPADWSRLARHPWFGVHTLQWWVELQLDESVQHLRQLQSLIGL